MANDIRVNDPMTEGVTGPDATEPRQVSDPVLARLYQEVAQCLGAARQHAANAQQQAQRARPATSSRSPAPAPAAPRDPKGSGS